MLINGVRLANTLTLVFDIKASRTPMIDSVKIKKGVQSYRDVAPKGANTGLRLDYRFPFVIWLNENPTGDRSATLVLFWGETSAEGVFGDGAGGEEL